jgi:hypothetical protein
MQCVSIIVCLCISIIALCGPRSSGTSAEPQEQATAKAGRFSTVRIDQQKSDPSALDIYLGGTGQAVRFFSWEPKQRGPRTYFNDVGMLYTQGWVTISGTMKGEGDNYTIEPPTQDPSMLAIWSDVIGPAIQVRTANTDKVGSYVFQSLDRKANYTFSIEQNGGLRWGAASRADMDTNLYRGAANTLKTDGSLAVGNVVTIGSPGPGSALHVGGSQSVKRTPVGADYAVTDEDYYVGVTDTSAQRVVALPTASGKTGRVYIIKDESGGAGKHHIMVKPQPRETIDGVAALPIRTNYGVLRIISNGNNWLAI